jgi:type I restriction enzyme S subunit
MTSQIAEASAFHSPASRPLPPGWRVTQLGEVLLDIQAGTSLTCEERPSIYPEWGVLKVSAVSWGVFKPEENKVLPPGFVVPPEDEVRSGDLLISRSNTTELVGATVLVRHTRPRLMLSDKTLRLVYHADRVCPEYLELALRGPLSRKFIEGNATGASSSMKNVSQGTIRRIPVVLPPLSEQRQIAAVLSEQLAAVERARAAAEAQLDAAEVLTGAYLRQAFSAEEAARWPRKQLKDVAAITSGIQKSPQRNPNSFHRPYLTVRNVQRGYLDLSQIERFEVTPEELARLRLVSGDLLIVEGNGSLDHIGRNALFVGDGAEWVHQNHIIRVRLDSSAASPEFISRFLNSAQGRAQMIEKAKTTSGLYTLSAGKVGTLEVPLPSLSIQQRLVETWNKQLAIAARVRDSLRAQLADINQLPVALLRRAFAGEL